MIALSGLGYKSTYRVNIIFITVTVFQYFYHLTLPYPFKVTQKVL